MRRFLPWMLTLCAWAVAPLAAQALTHLNVAPEQIVHLDFTPLIPDDNGREGQRSGIMMSTSDGTQRPLKAIPPGMALVITDLNVSFTVDPSEYPNGFQGRVMFGAQAIDYREFQRDVTFAATALPGHALASAHYSFTSGMVFSGKAIPVFLLTPTNSPSGKVNSIGANASGYLVPIGRSTHRPFPLPF